MARLALTVGGGVLGTIALGPGVGASLGMVIGGTVAGMLFPPPPTYGPKPEDTDAAPGTYGNAIGIAIGESDLGCDLIWVRNNEIDVRENKQSGGKGLGGPSHVTYESFATFALLICDGPITGLSKLYFGDELVYDGSAEALEEAINSGGPLPLTGALEGLTFRLYKGTEDQEPDPAIQAQDPHAPAWKGLSYMVFEDAPITKWGGRVPGDGVPVRAHVTAGPAKNLAFGLTPIGAHDAKGVTYDPTRGRIFVTTENSFETHVYDTVAGTLARTDSFAGIDNVWRSADYGSLSKQIETFGDGTHAQEPNQIGPAVAPDGSFYVSAFQAGESGGSLDISLGIVTDAETGQVLAQLGNDLNHTSGTDAVGFSLGPQSQVTGIWDHKCREVDWLPPDPLTGLRQFLYLTSQVSKTIYFGAVSIADRGAVQCPGYVKLNAAGSSNGHIYFDINSAGDTIYAFFREASTGTRKLCRIPISGFRAGSTASEHEANAYKPETTVNAGIAADPIDVWYNGDEDLIVAVYAGSVRIYDTDLALVASNAITDMTATGGRSRGGITDGTLWFMAGEGAGGADQNKLRGISGTDATIVEERSLLDWGIDQNTDGGPMWRNAQGDWIGWAAGTGSTGDFVHQGFILFDGRFERTKVALADVIRDAAERAGMSAADLDLTAVSRLIYGAPQKARNVTARGMIEDLLAQTGHHALISGGKLTVRPDASNPSGTLDETKLGADGRPPVKRDSDSSQPVRRLELKYKSVLADLEPAVQADEFPFEVLPHGQVLTVNTALRMDDDEAWESVQRLLTRAASEHTEYEAHFPYTEDVEPGQIWTLSHDGKAFDVRVYEVDGGFEKTLKGRGAWPFKGASGTPIDSSRPPQTLAQISVTDFALIDSHIWRDEDNDGACHIAAWPRRATAKWQGGVIFRGTDALALTDEFVALTEAATVAQAAGALGDVVSANHWDRLNTLTVRMLSGTPESATELEVLAGANPIWVECGTTGEWELAQYATATENADGSWTLSDFLRGRQGTEHLMGLHTPGDRVVWAETAVIRRAGGTAIGTQLAYASASVGASQEITTRRHFTNRARSLRPYSPASVAATRDGSDNISGTITRRSRITGDVAKTSRPLGEDIEAYQIDVLDAPGGNVLRMIEVSGTNAFSYSAADQTTDFGATQASVDVEVYQISATFGRGIALETTI